MKTSGWMRGTGLALLTIMTLLPLTATAADLSAAEEGTSLLARGGNGRGGYGPGDGTGTGTGPRDGSGNGAKTGDCVNS